MIDIFTQNIQATICAIKSYDSKLLHVCRNKVASCVTIYDELDKFST